MKKYYKKIPYRTLQAAEILKEASLGDWLYFADCAIRVDDGNVEHCCKNCAFYEMQRNHTKCPRLDYCAAHKRPDHLSVVFKDAKVIEDRHELYVRTKGVYNY